jgi:thiol-disulfide isomerase/thioredoxin
MNIMRFKNLSLLLGSLMVLSAPSRAADAPNPVVAPHARDLVALEGDHLAPFAADKFLQASYTVLFFSAGWCVDCRKFAPDFVKAYDAQPANGKRFEVLLLSRDKTPKDMLQYMRSEKMKWPALAFDKLAGAQDLEKFYGNHGIPCLTVIDQKGKVVLQSKSDQDALSVLKDLQALVNMK